MTTEHERTGTEHECGVAKTKRTSPSQRRPLSVKRCDTFMRGPIDRDKQDYIRDNVVSVNHTMYNVELRILRDFDTFCYIQ